MDDRTPERPLRVAFLTNIVSPYRRLVFQELAATPGWELQVIVNAKTEFDRKWSGECSGVDVVQTKSLSLKRKRVSTEPIRVEQTIEFHVPVGTWADLRRFDPDVVITHELGPRSWVAAHYCRWHKKPLVLWSYQSRASQSVAGRIRSKVRNAILTQSDAIVGMGIQARQVLEGFGVPPSDVIDAPNATDQSMIEDRLLWARTSGCADTLRQRYGQAGKKIAVVVGRLLPVKYIDGILALWADVPPEVKREWTLLFVGDGPLQPLIDACDDTTVQHAPGVPMSEIADYYAIADLHVFASLADVWGLVVNESMLCSVPTLCSTLAGCADDMIEHGRNGLLFDPLDTASARQALVEALGRDDLRELGKAARETGREYTIARLAAGFRTGVTRAFERREQRYATTTAQPG